MLQGPVVSIIGKIREIGVLQASGFAVGGGIFRCTPQPPTDEILRSWYRRASYHASIRIPHVQAIRPCIFSASCKGQVPA